MTTPQVKLCLTLATLVAVALGSSAGPVSAGSFFVCLGRGSALAEYDLQVDAILQNELPAVVGVLDEAMRKKDGGKALAEHVRLVRERLRALREIEPPPSVARLHAHTIDYYVIVLKAAESVEEHPDEDFTPYLPNIFAGIVAYYRELRDALVRQGCAGPMTEALETEVIPSYEQYLKLLEQHPR